MSVGTQKAQKAGKIVWPLIDMDPANPAGLDLFKNAVPPETPSASTALMKKIEELIRKRYGLK